MNKIVATILSLGTLIGMIYAVDSMYLHRADFEAFASAYSADKSETRVNALTQRQYIIEDRIEVLKDEGRAGNDRAVKELEKQKKEIQEQIELEKVKLKGLYDKK